MLASQTKVLYIGVTGNLPRRIQEHKNKSIEGFTKKYNCTSLVYFQQTENVMSALDREKQLKKWRRKKKIDLIEKTNQNWDDLNENLGY
ncbi:MAG: GIY-YIG nuclease family protein [Parcubacteria group bacterium]